MRGRYDEDEDDGYYSDEGRRRKWIAGALTLAVVGLAIGGFVYLRADNEERSFRPAVGASSSTATEVATSVAPPSTAAVPVTSTKATTAPTTTTPIATTLQLAAPSTSDTASTTTAPSTAATSSTAAVAQLPPVSSTAPSTAAATRPTSNDPVPTLPDGSPVPIVVVFDLDTITITGEVPSEASATRLETLALANSKTPAVVVSNMVVNPNVPINVGVRVIELNSVRFPESSAVVKLQHAAELNRVSNIMQALPNISVLVVGHADQRGSEQANFAISDARARAVVNYLISTGVSADRLSSRAVGATDLLSINDDATALALNRRTEFIFYGLLIE